MSKKTISAFLVCVIIAMATTFAAYFLLLDAIFDIKMRWLSLSWILFSEAIFLVKIITIKKQTIFSVSTITTSFFHMAFSVVCAVAFLRLAPESIRVYILINLVALAILAILDVLLIRAGGHVAEVNQQLSETQALINDCRAHAERLSIQYKDKEYHDQIAEIARLLKYSDNTFIASKDKSIPGMMGELSVLLGAESQNEEAIREKLVALQQIIQERAAQPKRGSY